VLKSTALTETDRPAAEAPWPDAGAFISNRTRTRTFELKDRDMGVVTEVAVRLPPAGNTGMPGEEGQSQIKGQIDTPE
jgi:hypothetical protein